MEISYFLPIFATFKSVGKPMAHDFVKHYCVCVPKILRTMFPSSNQTLCHLSKNSKSLPCVAT